MRALLIDAKDSFVEIIGQYLRSLGVEAKVVRNNVIDMSSIAAAAPDLIVLGPGPGHPADAGYVPIVRRFVGDIPIFGVCLGHQAIGLAFGAEVRKAEHLMHGKSSHVEHDGQGVFTGLAAPLRVTRYHSLIVAHEAMPDALKVTAVATDDGYVMGLRAPDLRLESVQFHPESVTTENGMQIFRNFVDKFVAVSAGYATYTKK